VARMYSNENFPLPVVEELRRLGHDVLTIQETGKAGQAVRTSVAIIVAFRSAKERGFRGAKGDNTTDIDSPVLSDEMVLDYAVADG